MWLDIAIVAGLIVWAVGGLIALNPLPWHIRKYWDAPGAKELRIIQAIALLLIVAGVTVFFAAEPGSFWHDLWPEMISTGGAVLGIDELNRRRSAQEYKRGIIRQMASRSNDFALDAARIAKDERWFYDGSLKKINLQGANLVGADFREANLTGGDFTFANLSKAYLFDANFAEARLLRANLAEATLTFANLKGAYLLGADLTNTAMQYVNLSDAYLTDANFEGADLQYANLSGAIYNNTRWPADFEPTAVGAIDWERMEVEDRIKWLSKFR